MDHIAHKRKDGEIQTVQCHSENTAALAERFADVIGLGSFGKISGKLHDSGKLCSDFGKYIEGCSKFRRGDIDHSYAGAKYIIELAQENAPEYRYTADFIARVIVSHHGLHDWADEDGGDYLKLRTEKNERYKEISSSVDEMIDKNELVTDLKAAKAEIALVMGKINNMCKKANTKDKRYFGFYSGLLERFLESVLVDADRTDTEIFARNRDNRLRYDRKYLWETMHRAMEEKCTAFRSRTDNISQRRTSISDRCAAFAEHDVGICRLIVPTGGGKTLSSLRFAIEYCRRMDMDRIIYVAPFMSILEQNGNEMLSLLGDELKELYLEHHSEAVQKLADSGEELNEYESRAEKWDSPVIATTLVQFLNTLFGGSMTSVRRTHRLSRSVIIIDEVQSIPLKCVHLFDLAMNFLSEICGSTIVLCSATQPHFENTDFALLIDENDRMTGDCADDFAAFKRTALVDSTKSGGYSYEEAAEFCYDKFLSSDNILVVVNTKEAARNLYRLMKEQDHDSEEPAAIFHLSTGMCPEHRRKTLNDIKSLLEKKRVICVTTQLIEAGVDISFDCVVRSLAGLDNAAQAAGRCNRNGSTECRNVYIINISDEKLSRLTDITEAGKVTKSMINSGQFDDLLSVDAMSQYFAKLYSERKELLSYPVTDCEQKTNLVEMLSLSRSRLKLDPPMPRQCFLSAGKHFKVIDDDTVSVIVPYDRNAEEIIEKLCGADEYTDYSALAKKAQRYSVNIFGANLKNYDVYLSDSGFYILRDGYYSREYGISSDKVSTDFLCC